MSHYSVFNYFMLLSTMHNNKYIKMVNSTHLEKNQERRKIKYANRQHEGCRDSKHKH